MNEQEFRQIGAEQVILLRPCVKSLHTNPVGRFILKFDFELEVPAIFQPRDVDALACAKEL